MVLEERIAAEMQKLRMKYFGDQSLEMSTPVSVPPTYQGMLEEEAVEAEEDFYYMWRFSLRCRDRRATLGLSPHAEDKVTLIFYVGMDSKDALPTFPYVKAFSCIEKKLGLSLDTIYSSTTPSLIVAASLGQVYKARLKYFGQDVAVKAQKPGIEEAIGLDFYLIMNLGIFINKNIDIITSDVVALIDEFARRVSQELNYVSMEEGQNARRFKKLYVDQKDVLCQISSGNFLNMDFFHAGPHPGNPLATPEGKLTFLDFRMMSETPEEARFAIIGHVVQMVNRDYEAMARD
ncbi:hypothetical protein GIB67_026071 [Kingdonia uniflora]|uniref:ABC1 atypical kinase-like domain-containing protein n=1 Tax=Kingdonia uniflora TaxID=39325 RepID=A0A7J7M2V0_9MAGN|nr:hypothetical protein GIB67_026071 [Kingdonia uniflora]